MMSTGIILLVLINTVFTQFQSAHWPNGSTDFVSRLENSRVKGIYIPFRQYNPLLNISMERINNKSQITEAVPSRIAAASEPVPILTTPTTTTNSQPTSDGPIRIPLPIEDNSSRCEILLKTYVDENEALKFEVRVYAIQFADKTVENEEMKKKIRDIEIRNISLFTKVGNCEDEVKLLSKQLRHCKSRRLNTLTRDVE